MKDDFCRLLDLDTERHADRTISRFDARNDMRREPDGYMPEPTEAEWLEWCEVMSESEEGVLNRC